MKKKNIIIIVAVAVAAVIVTTYLLPMGIFLFGSLWDVSLRTNAEIEIDSYRLCQDKDDKDVIIVKYLLKNKGKEPTSLCYEATLSVYQNGVSLNEVYEEDEKYPKEWNYDSEDQYKNIKGGVEYYAEVAYYLEDKTTDVEVEVNDYGLFEKDKEKVFKIK